LQKIFLHATSSKKLEVVRNFPKFDREAQISRQCKASLTFGRSLHHQGRGLRGVGYQSMIFLTLIFTCGDGCGFPVSVTLPTPYETQK
jgi:hypothetical protein